VLVLALVLGCSTRPPCDEPTPGPLGDIALVVSSVEPANARYVHLVTFEMGPVSETLEGYMLLRAPDALRIYGMTETGQKAFDVAVLQGKVTRLYRAPFLKDDRVLDLVAQAAVKIFLLRPRSTVGVAPSNGGYALSEGEASFFWAGPRPDLRWLAGKRFSACFMDWSDVEGVRAPRRIHFHSDEGPYPYDLRMKLLRASALGGPAGDEVFRK
jgi:hypothetical protein